MKPYKIYGENIEKGALTQFFNTMEQPCVLKGALMADSHQGYTLPIGGVVATDNIIFPSFIGFDIGCGVCAYKTNYKIDDVRENSVLIRDEIKKNIPVGFKHREYGLSWTLPKITEIGQKIFYDKKGFKQLGTLGGGNHYLSIGYDRENYIWVEVHSGSRGVGHAIATHYMKLASNSDKPKEGYYGFEVDSENGINYITDMNFCLSFALESRKRMIYYVLESMNYVLGKNEYLNDVKHFINRNHNHAEIIVDPISETEFDHTVVHRKGATHAEKGMMGIIPGNMRDGSFIVRGLGNPDSLCSSSHGAGRVMSRTGAKKNLNQEKFDEEMVGIVCETEGRLDESPDAYKNIFEVMENQKDLVEIVEYIKPLINIKG